jgi:hypothetical protein
LLFCKVPLGFPSNWPSAFEARYDLPVVFVPTARAGACLVERWAFYFARETVAAVNDLLAGELKKHLSDE